MRLLCLAGLPRLQSFASVLLCQGSCLADRSHTPSTYPLGTRLSKQPWSLDIANKVFWAFLSCEDCPNTSNARTPFPWVAHSTLDDSLHFTPTAGCQQSAARVRAGSSPGAWTG